MPADALAGLETDDAFQDSVPTCLIDVWGKLPHFSLAQKTRLLPSH